MRENQMKEILHINENQIDKIKENISANELDKKVIYLLDTLFSISKINYK